MTDVNASIIAIIILCSSASTISAKQTCHSPESMDGYLFVGVQEIKIPAKYASDPSIFRLSASERSPQVGPVQNCESNTRHFDLIGLPLDTELPETVYPYYRRDAATNHVNESWSTVILYALPASPAALSILHGAGGSESQPSPAWDEPRHMNLPENTLKIEKIVFGPYIHFGVSGSYRLNRRLATQPSGVPLTFTCDPGQKWTSCSINYALSPHLGLQYTIFFIAINPRDKQWQANVVRQMVTADAEVRASAMTYLFTQR